MLNGFAHAGGRSRIPLLQRLWVEKPVDPETPSAQRLMRQQRHDDTTDALSYPPYAAARWCLAGDVRATLPLWTSLQAHALARHVRGGRLRRQPLEDWRPFLRSRSNSPISVAAEVARIVICEHGPTASLFTAAPMLRCWLLDIEPRIWNQHLARPHAALTEMLERWYTKGLEQLRGWIIGRGAHEAGQSVLQKRSLEGSAPCGAGPRSIHLHCP